MKANEVFDRGRKWNTCWASRHVIHHERLQNAVVLFDLIGHELGQDRPQQREEAGSVEDSHNGVEHDSWLLVHATRGMFHLVIEHSEVDGVGEEDHGADPHQDREHDERGLPLFEGTEGGQPREAQDAEGDEIRPHQKTARYSKLIRIHLVYLIDCHRDFNREAERHQSDDLRRRRKSEADFKRQESNKTFDG